MAVPTKDLVDLLDDVLAVIFDQILVTIGVWKTMNLRVLCRLFNTIVPKTLCLDHMANSEGPVDDALEICLKYPESKLPGIAHLFIHLEMKYNPHHTILSPVYYAIQSVKARINNIQTRDEQTAFEIKVCHAIEERLKWGSNDDRDPGACGRRRSQFRNAVVGEDGEARLDIQTILSVAIIAGDASVVRELLVNCNADADLDNEYFGRPIHLAASYGRTEIIEILLECGADLSSIRPYLIHQSKRFTMHLQKFICTFESPLRIAALNGHLKAVTLLTEPRYNAVLPFPEEEIQEAFRAAARSGSIALISILAESFLGSLPWDLPANIREEMLIQNINFAVSATWETMPNWSPIHCAAYKGRSKVDQLLLENGANRDSFATAIRVHCNSLDAIGFAVSKDHEDVVHVPLNHASFWNQHHIMRLLLKNTADSDRYMDRSALSYPIEVGDPLTLRLLIEAGYPVETIKDVKSINYNSSPVLLAMKCGWPHILEYLFSVNSEKIDPLDEEQFLLGSTVRNDFTSGQYPRRHAKEPYQLWYIQGRY
ncbi:putative ankyrin repeat protein [Botrytis fragariae]|uniref:Putative ankyrin repeat protein n=1 Tax=Botrytis fragariae TaxID=1964551 RepID=A0A8H6AIW3_9HELO|nr:putative ankyrin repeat protein [Botrytis fragariae]KAF5868197.1 putative ankyrin repeat protein [Botrytis fragariae]